ncbi:MULTISPECIES: glycosyltransferase family 2 protein [Bacillus]|uniref:glycosyltransferase family 2 protein n=1 Tax=Bacillus TaxID=1386 RepID=UPI00031B9356|nr:MULTISPECIES: glycosyltransferase family 2 protein [Bacillus]
MEGLSIIIPFYNVEKYIEACLQSVVNSMDKLSNVQIILVDDGSKDSSGQIAKRFVKQYSNITYVSKENGGLSDARNYGLRYVKYNYVTFIDSDDYIAEDYFFEIFKAIQSKPDLIVFDWVDVGEKNYRNIVNGMELPNVLWTIQPSAWNKVYRKNLFDEVLFPKGKIYEDVGTTYKLLYYVNDFVYLKKPLYMYRKNRVGSILTTISPKINDIYHVLEDTYSFYKEKEALSVKNTKGLCYQYVKILLWSNMYRQLKLYKFNLVGFHMKMKQTRSLIYDLFPEWKSNTYINEKEDFFKERLGRDFVGKVDKIGKSFIETTAVIFFLILKNRKRY